MTDEQSPESTPQGAAPPSVPPPSVQPQQMSLPLQNNICQYELDGWECSNPIRPETALRDSENGKLYCKECGKECYDCGNVHPAHDMQKVQSNRNVEPRWYCSDCYNDSFAVCPACDETVYKDDILLPNSRNRFSMKEGGCTQCSEKCNSCGKVVDKDYFYFEDVEGYCEDCHSKHFRMCDECQETFNRDDLIYVENDGEYCSSCYGEKYVRCEKCDTTLSTDDAISVNNDYYCQDCYEEVGPTQYSQYTDNFSEFSYTRKDRYLNLLYKLLPISVKDLKSKHPTIASGLADLISFAKGKPLTHEIVKEYRATLAPEDFPIKYTVWDGVQRSVDTLEDNPIDKPQLVINVVASPEMLNKLKANPALYDLFDKINTLSKESTHPYVRDQIGWVRVEIDPSGEYLLVDEVQSDHSNASFRLKNSEGDYEIRKIRSALKEKYKMDDEGLNKLLSVYAGLLKDFPNIASQAATRFARRNKIKKIFWHTYESGKKLKENEPPKSLYEKTPKENFFLPSQNKPFGLEGEFFEKEANKLYRLARKFYIKYLIK